MDRVSISSPVMCWREIGVDSQCSGCTFLFGQDPTFRIDEVSLVGSGCKYVCVEWLLIPCKKLTEDGDERI